MSTFDASQSGEELATDYSAQHPEAGFITTQIQCASCGGDLLGLSTLGMCPSCGTTVRATLIAIDKRKRMIQARGALLLSNCARCGYDLSGLDDDGYCPECGASIALSRRGNLLQASDPEYLRRVHSGASLVLTSVLIMIFSPICAFAVMVIAAASAWPAGALLGLSILLLMPVGAIGWMWGWWKFSTKDPMFTDLDESSSSRRRSRVFLVAYLALIGGAMFLMMAPAGFGPGRLGGAAASLPLLGVLAYFGGLVMLVFQYVYSMLYIRWLALRIPDRRLADWAKTLTWLGPLVYIVGSLIVIGPLITLGFYWSLMDNMRKEIKAIRRQNAADAQLP